MKKKQITLCAKNTWKNTMQQSDGDSKIDVITDIAREKLHFLNSIGVSQDALAVACGVNRRTIYNWLNKKSQKIPFLAVEKILKISEAFSSAISNR